MISEKKERVNEDEHNNARLKRKRNVDIFVEILQHF